MFVVAPSFDGPETCPVVVVTEVTVFLKLLFIYIIFFKPKNFFKKYTVTSVTSVTSVTFTA